MPVAGGNIGAGAKYHYQDHDTDRVNMAPPEQNTWYEVFDADDVRLLWQSIYQSNTEAAAKDVEARWTIDGQVYLGMISLPDSDQSYVYRTEYPSAAGTAGLFIFTDRVNAAWNVDKRGRSFKVEVRMTGLPGAAQTLTSNCVRETLEVT